MAGKIISIVTSSYNQADYIAETIDSVITQNGGFYIDYVVIDAGSSDNTVDIIKDFEKRVKRDSKIISIKGLKFYKGIECKCMGISFRWISEPDNGHAEGLNKGFRKTVGDYMAWINSDDKYHPGAFEVVCKVFSEFGEVDWLFGKYSWWDREGKEINRKNFFLNSYDFVEGNYCWLQQESSFWRRSLWNKVGGVIDESYKLMVDGELWCRFYQYSEPFFVDRCLGGFRVWGKNRSKLFARKVEAEMDKAISGLKKVFPKEKRFIQNNMQILRRVLCVFPVERLMRFLFKDVYQKLDYNFIMLESDRWVMSHRNYSIVNLNWVLFKKGVRRFFKW